MELVRYDFGTIAPTAVATGATASDAKRTDGVDALIKSVGYTTDPVVQIIDRFSGGSIAFTLTPDADTRIDMTAFKYKVAKGGSSTRGIEWEYSLDGGATWTNFHYIANVPSARPLWTDYTVPLVLSSEGPIQFRGYSITTQSFETMEIDEVVVDGTPVATGAAAPDVLDHQFAGSGTFAGDAAFTNLAGTAPTLVSAGDGQIGLRFPTGAQSLVHTTIASTLGRLVVDAVVELSGIPGGAVELIQLRGAAKVVSVNLTSTGKIQVAGTGSATSVDAAPTGKHRLRLDRNGDTITLTIYANDDDDTVQQVPTITQTAVAITSIRLGFSSAASTVDATVSWVQVATDPAMTGPRDYASVVTPPQVLADAVPPQEPWTIGVLLSGSYVEGSNPVASAEWAPAPGNPAVLDAGSGTQRTFTTPAFMDPTDLDFTFTVTDSAGQSASATVTVPVLPATYAVLTPDGWKPYRRSVITLPDSSTRVLTSPSLMTSTSLMTGA